MTPITNPSGRRNDSSLDVATRALKRLIGVMLAVAMMAGVMLAQASPAAAHHAPGFYVSMWGVNPLNGGLRVSANTSVPTRATLVVSTEETYRSGVTWEFRSPTVTTNHRYPTPGLQAYKVHYYKLTLIDESGHSTVRSGTVRTNHHRAVVTIQTVRLRDDSDLASDGDITMDVAFGTARRLNVYGGEVNWPSGYTAGPNVTLEQVDGAATVSGVSVKLVDSDHDCCHIDTTGYPSAWDSGSNADWDWATATAWLRLRDFAPDTRFTMQMSVSAALVFDVTFTVIVTYF